MARREYKGAAERLTTSGGLAASGDLSFTSNETPSAGWPTGAGGKFLIAVDRGLASEEKMLATSRTGTSFSVIDADRGFDGTTKQSHSANAALEHVLGAIDLDEPNEHIFDTAEDAHTQYHNTARHAAVNHIPLLAYAFSAWAPTFANAGSPTFGGSASTEGRYVQLGDIVIAQFSAVLGTSPSMGSSDALITFPVNARVPTSGRTLVGHGYIYDDSTGTARNVVLDYNATGNFRLLLTVSPYTPVTNANPWAPGLDDVLLLNLMYEAA